MASKMLPVAVVVAFIMALLNFAPAFVGPQPALRNSRTQMANAKFWDGSLTRDLVEITFTAPAVGARSRFMVSPDVTQPELLKMGRKALGFDQDWIPDSDFELYNADDEDAGPITGPLRNHGVADFEYEVHMYFKPASY
eukprot:TRINITY_DN1162_c0_g1_i6.p1 TRINITY_DN1162_c0_g1~~TRINITY_DN1162_c0_g1_i6.p1  ORF type:complete len:139 (+),score=34.23 TRINITY_DN1162_c0_g1_i6:86-502(+)